MKITGAREIDMVPPDGSGSDNGITNIILSNGDVVALSIDCVNYLTFTVDEHGKIVIEIDIMEVIR